MIVNKSKENACSIYRNRFAMYDYARGNCVREAFLMDLLDSVASMYMTGLAVYIEDLALFSKPELHQGSIGPDGWRRLNAYARERHLILLPLINIYGHNEQTLQHLDFRHLRDDLYGKTLNYSMPETRALIECALDNVTGIFDSPFIHIGFDEVWGMGYSEETATGKPIDVPSVFAANLQWACNEVIRRGRRPMIWADIPGIYYPEIIPDLPRELIPVDWFYRAEQQYPTMQRWIQHGFELWVAPTIGYSNHGMNIWPDGEGLADHAVAVIDAGRTAGASGIIFTAWQMALFPYLARLPILAWEAKLAQGQLVGRGSLREGTRQWLACSRINDANRFAELSLTVGSIFRLFPPGLDLECQSFAEFRWRWYKHDSSARRNWQRIRTLLESIREDVAPFSDLQLAWNRYLLFCEILNPEQINTKMLSSLVEAIEPEVKAAWIIEKTEESYHQEIEPQFSNLKCQLSKWPLERISTAPPFSPQIIHASYGVPEKASVIEGFHDKDGKLESCQTSVSIWYTDDALNFRFEPGLNGRPLRSVERSVDFLLTRDDSISISLDFHGKGEGYLWVISNFVGQSFLQIHDADNINYEWHPLSGKKKWAKPETIQGKFGLFLSIPFRELGILAPSPGDKMGLMMERRHAWLGEFYSWGNRAPFGIRDHPRCLSNLIFV